MIVSKLIALGTAGLLGTGAICTVCVTQGSRIATASASARPVVAGAVAELPSDTARVNLAIEGMTCGSCATTARIVLEKVPGVLDAEVSYDESAAVVLYDASEVSPPEFIARLEEMTGYEARVVEDDDALADT